MYKKSDSNKCKQHPEVQCARDVIKFVKEVIVQYEALINGLIMFTSTLSENSTLSKDG